MLELQWPWLLLILPLPLVMLILPAHQKTEAALRVPFFNRVEKLQSHTSSLRRKYLTGQLLLWCIWLCVVLSATNPRWIGEATSVPNSGRDLMMAVDISESMLIEDMKYNGDSINRLIAIKHVIGNFVETRKSDRLGLILFASNAYLQAPLTFDRESVNKLLQEAEIGFAGQATAIGDAIGLAIKRLRNRPDAQRVLIILTDGANTAGELDPIKAAELAETEHVKIYTIGFGADEMIVSDGFFGSRRVNPSQDLDEPTMKAIAQKTGGQYFRARNVEELNAIHQELNHLEPIESDKETFRPIKDLFFWPLGVGMLISLLWAFWHLVGRNSMTTLKGNS